MLQKQIPCVRISANPKSDMISDDKNYLGGNPESSSHAQSIKYLLGDLVSSGNSESTIGL